MALEEKAVQLSDPFLQKGISLIVDGSDPELTKDILESEMDHKYENAKKQIQFWKDLGSYAPAWGMVGKFPFSLQVRIPSPVYGLGILITIS